MQQTRPMRELAALSIWGMVALGLGLRLYHYLRNPSVWHDEIYVICNVFDKGFAELLGKLSDAEAAPPLFLWIEKVNTILLGDSTFALRLWPFLASCLAMILMVPSARHLLQPRAVPWALLLFACSDRLLWHACEAKPYASDTFGAAMLLALYCLTSSWRLAWRLALFTLCAPFLIFLSYPGCFVCGGLLVALLPAVFWEALDLRGAKPRLSHAYPLVVRRWTPWLGYMALTLSVLVAFALLYAGPIRAQRNPTQIEFWESIFPHWDRPWTVPWWAVRMTVQVVDYAFRPAGGAFIVLAAVGTVCLWRRRLRAEVVLLLLPIFLALGAACFWAYPYEGSRLMAYAIPAIVLLVAEGIPSTFCWLRDQAARRTPTRNASAGDACVPRLRVGLVSIGLANATTPGWRAMGASLAPVMLYVFLAVPVAATFYRLGDPWLRADYAAASTYVLHHLEPTDGIVSNATQQIYYFRHIEGAARTPTNARHWLLVVGAKTAEERLRIAQKLWPTAARTLEQREFRGVTVLLRDR